MAEPSLGIALATWNGVRWLPELLASFLAQSRQPDQLVIADDGSTDGTLAVIQTFAAMAPFPVQVLPRPPGAPSGVIANFARALAVLETDLIALADQDDRWHPAKLQKVVECWCWRPALRALVHDLRVVDATGQVQYPSFWRSQNYSAQVGLELGTLCVMNSFPGCALVVTRSVVARALPMPSGVVMHDWWLLLLARCEGEVYSLGEALVDYRQHGQNVVGALDVWALWRRPFRHWRGVHNALKASAVQCREVVRRVPSGNLDRQRRRTLVACILSPRMPPVTRHWLLASRGIRTTGWMRRLSFILRA